MTKTRLKSGYSPKYKYKSQTIIPKIDPSISVPSNLQNFQEKIISGNSFLVYHRVLNTFN